MSENTTVDATELNSVPPTAEVKEADTTPAVPKVETREGKIFVDGVRVYHRDETNKIAATAKQEAVKSILQELEVDDIGQVKQLVKSLRETSTEGNNTLNIEQLKDLAKRREQTVEELQSKIVNLQRTLVEKEHISNLLNAMPLNWDDSQKQIALKLMKADGMIIVDGERFAIRNGDTYFTEDGETPDYKSAVDFIAKQLKYPIGKQGVDIPTMDKGVSNDEKDSGLFDPLLNKDKSLNNAYVKLKKQPQNALRNLTIKEVKAYAKSHSPVIGQSLIGASSLRKS